MANELSKVFTLNTGLNLKHSEAHFLSYLRLGVLVWTHTRCFRLFSDLRKCAVMSSQNKCCASAVSFIIFGMMRLRVASDHTWAFCFLRTPLQNEISFLADTLWILQENHKMFDGASLACIVFGFLVDFPCARFENTWSATRVS